ncbi:DUF2927 domain-containing protein [Candidatus Methylomicrobium oryzae]|uniref:DUF2927 domain-containing protein n=1 Tax=Candidatus Methylomicrobium oryzae TaxID=2802053 RepID=UPI001923EC2C|nr:DUF2927 domain-containing protein [Methylomicrobium sp. RS1]MBL1265509.1 DUF2927 domain-containing protein [Methylomicrobium sp. RS1]
MQNKIYRIITSLLLSLCLLGPKAATAAPTAPLDSWQSPGYLLKSFIEIAMFNEYSAQPMGVRKWTRPVGYYFVHRVGDQALHERLARMHIEQLAKITGLAMEPAKTPASANLLVIFSTEMQLRNELLQDFGIRSKPQREALFRDSVCLGHFTPAKDGSIVRGVVLIPVDRANAHAKLVDCIVEEITQVLGLPNDSDKVFPSIFNDKSVNTLLSGLDYLLLKMLYDPRIKSGMNLQEAAPVLKTIVGEFERNGWIRNADANVRTGGLYGLLYGGAGGL